LSSTFAQAKKPATEYRFRGKPEESQQGFYWRVALRKLQHPEIEMKHILLTTIAAVVLATTAFAGPIHDAAASGNPAAFKWWSGLV